MRAEHLDTPYRRGGGAMQIIDRIGIDIGIKKSVEDGLLWAAAHGLHYVDFRLDTSPDAFVAFTSERCEAIRTRAEADGITIGLHTLSAVNIAENSPYLAEAVVCLSPADNSHGSLLGRLKGAHQPVIKPRNRFSVLVHPSLPACRQTDSAP